MARVTVEDCVEKISNRFELVMIAAQRSRELSVGAELTVERDNDKNPVVALREIADETVMVPELEEEIILGLQHHGDTDDGAPRAGVWPGPPAPARTKERDGRREQECVRQPRGTAWLKKRQIAKFKTTIQILALALLILSEGFTEYSSVSISILFFGKLSFGHLLLFLF